ncbi:hypothetical protein C8R43DRAFT_1139213 [Mycena crocata]|nr:hypothetical protein C8R43DRAFT_1139213 [Mycena crocata]
MRGCCGERTIDEFDTSTESASPPLRGPNVVQILDFSLSATDPRSASELATTTRCTTRLHLEPSLLDTQGLFKDPVSTSLPYQETLLAAAPEYEFFLMDQDRLIGVKAPEDDDSVVKMGVYTS